MKVPGIVNLIAASCILHNICEVPKNEVLEAWINEATALPQPDSLPDSLGGISLSLSC